MRNAKRDDVVKCAKHKGNFKVVNVFNNAIGTQLQISKIGSPMNIYFVDEQHCELKVKK